jgi:hypothetical protein
MIIGGGDLTELGDAAALSSRFLPYDYPDRDITDWDRSPS